VNAKVGTLVALLLAVAAFFGTIVTRSGAPIGAPAVILGFAVAFAVVSRFEMHLEFGRVQVAFSVAEIVFVVALFSLGPVGVAIAGGAGEALARAVRGLPPLKVLFNAANHLCALMVAAAGFWLIGSHDPHNLVSWAAALAATLCFSIINMASLATVLALVEHRGFHDMFVRSAPMSTLVTLAATPLGLIGLDLYNRAVWGPVLLVPLATAVVLNTRYGALQRDEHLRFGRLYEASSRTARLLGFDEAIETVAQEARHLLAATWAACCAQTPTGEWTGVLVSDDGTVMASDAAVEAMVGLSFGRQGQEIGLDTLSPSVHEVLPRAASMVLAPSPEGALVPLVLAAFRRGSPDDSATSHAQTLAAFASQAALAVGNGRLYGEVEDALRHQLDLNRQKTDFVAAVSHELRTPLTSMLGSVQTLQRLGTRATDDRRDWLLDMTNRQGLRLKRLIEELLLVASAEQSGISCKQELVDMAALLDDVRSELGSPTADRINIDTGIVPVRIITDRLMLQQVLLNLVENAGKYAPDGPIELHAEVHGPTAVVRVRDHGPGIPEDQRERVFERFVQLDQSSTRRNGGTGLGLYLCRKLAGALGGQLDLEGGAGSGCSFCLQLPTGFDEPNGPSGPQPADDSPLDRAIPNSEVVR
jgi:signal transduction histidine kinase